MRLLIRPLGRLFKMTRFWQETAILLRQVKQFPALALMAVLWPLLAAGCEGFGISFLFGFLQNLVSPSAPPFQTGIGWFDTVILAVGASEHERLLRVSALILVSTWMRAGFNFLTIITMDTARFYLVNLLQKQMYEQLQSLALRFFGQAKAGELINTLTAELSNLQQALMTISFIISKSLVLLIYVLVLVKISWQLTLTATLLFSVIVVGLGRLNSWVRQASFPVSAASGKFTAIAVELINGMRTIHASATQDHERYRFYAAADQIMTASQQLSRVRSLTRPLAEGLATTVLVSIIVLAMSVFVANGTLQVATLLTFLFVLFRLVPAIQDIVGCLTNLSGFQGSIQIIEQFLRTEDKPYLVNGDRKFEQLRWSIAFVAVDFGYEPGQRILQDVTLTIEKGQTVALVGGSGAGKTTLADLIPRFYDPVQGQIFLDGYDLRQYDIQTVRQRIAVVSQDTFIFNTSVRNNLAYGLDGITDTQIVEVARRANALEFILALPEGFDTELGDRGVRLSGGQRQRLAIARALLRNPDILILDEATSALDSVSERLIQQSIEELSVGRTVIAIAHRLSTIERADKVVVLEKGQIVEQGSYQELLFRKGHLWNYHKMQQSGSLV
jgi:ATP-binding cassette, subfamily B, bacterial MsbA